MTAQTEAGQSEIAEPTTALSPLKDVRVLVLFGGSELFGQERANLEVFRNLSRLGLKARFIISGKWGGQAIQPELNRMGFDWKSAPFGYHWGKSLVGREFYLLFVNLWGVLATSWRVWNESRRWDATHIYAANWRHWFYAAPGIRLTRKPLIFRAGDELPANTFFHRWTGRQLLRDASRVVCNARFLADKFSQLGLEADKLRIIHNYPPRRSVSAPERLPETAPHTLVVVFVGQISEHKGASLFVEAAKVMAVANSDIVFWLVGASTWGNPLEQELKRDVAKAGLDRQIQFLGYRENVPEILRRAHIHVCPSTCDDASPNVVLEAKKEGVPSVVFPVGGLPELVEHGVDGFICQDRTARGLIEGIEYFMMDPNRRLLAGAAARRSLDEKFGKHRFRRDWTEVFVATRRQVKPM